MYLCSPTQMPSFSISGLNYFRCPMTHVPRSFIQEDATCHNTFQSTLPTKFLHAVLPSQTQRHYMACLQTSEKHIAIITRATSQEVSGVVDISIQHHFHNNPTSHLSKAVLHAIHQHTKHSQKTKPL